MIERFGPTGNPKRGANMQFWLVGDPSPLWREHRRPVVLILASFAGLAALFAAAG